MAMKYQPPNVKKYDHPPTKKPKMSQVQVHITVNIVPSEGNGMAASYVVSSIRLLSSPPILSQSQHVGSNVSHTSCSAPASPTLPGLPNAPSCPSRLLLILDCKHTSRLPSILEVLTLLDFESPVANLRHIDAIGEFLDFGIADVVDLYSLLEELLGTFGSLGREGAHHVHQYVHDKVLDPLGLLQTRDDKEVIVVEDDESIANTDVGAKCCAALVQLTGMVLTLLGE